MLTTVKTAQSLGAGPQPDLLNEDGSQGQKSLTRQTLL
jgi:hypothetical protein